MELKPGIVGKQSVMVTEAMTAQKLGSGELPVLATPQMIALMENTAYKSVAAYLGEGQGTVGTRIAVNHLAATPVGMEVSLESELVEIDRKRLVFTVKAYDASGCIGEGEHERFIIDNQRFLEKAEAKKTGA
ncbi:MAG: thioesterase family protein [Lachnospiraceae bacterium]|nr:thioesterase family protein [Lachnospiraceae bacterium]MDD7050270.1 thioesterase family protein [Lachnospiraceae bacterium]MDY4095676.1 thioesterase family protein [Lachnospiraceae bacterium]